jgi:hypothetical protein
MDVDKKIIKQVMLFVTVSILAVLVVALVGFLASRPADKKDVNVSDGNPKLCTLEARACPDGSYVGRNPAKNCEFDACPNTIPTEVLTCCNQPDWYSCTTPEEIMSGTDACQQGGCAACQK